MGFDSAAGIALLHQTFNKLPNTFTFFLEWDNLLHIITYTAVYTKVSSSTNDKMFEIYTLLLYENRCEIYIFKENRYDISLILLPVSPHPTFLVP